MQIDRRTFLSGSLAAAGAAAVGTPLSPLASAAAAPARRTGPGTLTNLGHLDALCTTVTPPTQAGHTTYQLAQEPAIGVLWVYANYTNGTYVPTGGGTYDAAANTYGQGAYDADDISRAAVVYIRHWRQWGDAHSQQAAYQLLRGLTYLQTSSGPDAGNVVLWMQPDGTLNPTPTPPDSPNPSDSGPSWWLGRTLWALGEGYAAFEGQDSAFAAFLAERFQLALGSLRDNVLNSYGTYLTVNGRRVPAWLLTGGADASSEACLGLDAYAAATGDSATKQALSQLSEGIAALSTGTPTTWPFGAILQDATDLSLWHAYGDQLAGALTLASTTLHESRLQGPAVSYGAGFVPHLIVQGGPDNEWLPSPIAAPGQISYGAYSVFADLVALANTTRAPGFEQLAGFAASWWFGNNPGGVVMYDAATGVCFDGVTASGPNQNSGAESTICALLGMIDLDAMPDVAAAAQVATVSSRVTWDQIPASSATLSGDATLVTSAPSSSSESQWSGGYVSMGPGGAACAPVTLPVAGRYRVFPIVDLQPAGSGASATAQQLGSADAGQSQLARLGAQGSSPYPDELVVDGAPLTGTLPAGATTVSSSSTGSGTAANLNGWLVQPEVETLVLTGSGGTRALLRSFADNDTSGEISIPPGARATISVYDLNGRLRRRSQARGPQVSVPLGAGAFSVVEVAGG